MTKNNQSFGKVPKAKTIALRKGTEKNNVLRNNRIKNGIEATENSPILCLNLVDLGYCSIRLLLFKN